MSPRSWGSRARPSRSSPRRRGMRRGRTRGGPRATRARGGGASGRGKGAARRERRGACGGARRSSRPPRGRPASPSRRASSESEAAARGRSLRRRESLARRRASNERRGSDAVGFGRDETVLGGDALGSSRSRARRTARPDDARMATRAQQRLVYPIDGSANQTPPFRRKSSKIFPPFKSTGEDDRSTRNSKLKKESSPVTDAEISAVE